MSVYGGDMYIIEGSKGKEIYNMILKSVEKCVEFNDDYYDNFLSNDMSVQNHEYELGIFIQEKLSDVVEVDSLEELAEIDAYYKKFIQKN